MSLFCLFFSSGKPQENPLNVGEITKKQYGASKSVSFVPGADLLDEDEEKGMLPLVLFSVEKKVLGWK